MSKQSASSHRQQHHNEQRRTRRAVKSSWNDSIELEKCTSFVSNSIQGWVSNPRSWVEPNCSWILPKFSPITHTGRAFLSFLECLLYHLHCFPSDCFSFLYCLRMLLHVCFPYVISLEACKFFYLSFILFWEYFRSTKMMHIYSISLAEELVSSSNCHFPSTTNDVLANLLG